MAAKVVRAGELASGAWVYPASEAWVYPASGAGMHPASGAWVYPVACKSVVRAGEFPLWMYVSSPAHTTQDF